LRSTLFLIPHAIGGVPLFGFGLCLALLIVGFLGWAIWKLANKQSASEILGGAWFVGFAAVLVVFVLPSIEQTLPDGTPIGLPIRGYGVMVLLGLFCGIGVTTYRGQQLGISADTVIGLGFWMMLGGVLGARIFYVVQKWNDDFAPLTSPFERLRAIVMLTEGGLVIYGGVIGGLIAGAAFCYREKLNVAATADLIAPGFLIGLSLGRIGCLLHGCCFGGVCLSHLPSIQFPNGSGPYIAQAASGELLGLKLNQRNLPAEVTAVAPGSPAELQGIHAGTKITDIRLHTVAKRDANPAEPDGIVVDIAFTEGQTKNEHTLFPEDLPARSLPVHPSQVYAAINALLLCLLVWLIQPFPKQDGVTFLAAILLYAISRFLLEGVRSDEAGQLGTPFTIAQLVSLGSGFIAVLGLGILLKRPKERAWNW
jgi:phosphatidylglycerol---prolipoprotein diacylglyceryl transferase